MLWPASLKGWSQPQLVAVQPAGMHLHQNMAWALNPRGGAAISVQEQSHRLFVPLHSFDINYLLTGHSSELQSKTLCGRVFLHFLCLFEIYLDI